MVAKKDLTVAWFSAGVSSAVATKLVINEIDKIIYTHIDDQHEDTMRFIVEIADWYGKEIKILQSDVRDVSGAMSFFPSRGFGRFSPCTQILKRRVREEWERERKKLFNLTYVWGLDCNETERAERITGAMPKFNHRFPLIEQSVSKEHAHQILNASGIARPAMYELGYHNNNCIGCVKGGMGYWNKIRRDFPEVFAQRAALERKLEGHFLKDCYLDELDPERGRHEPPIVDDCGIFCELEAL